MRDAISEVWKGSSPQPTAHAGLLYEIWAPVVTKPDDKDIGKIDKEARDEWLDRICGVCTPEGYQESFKRWKESLDRTDAVCVELQTQSRLLIGHGNAAPTEVGLTLHHTWGVPVIPGTALKGLLSHYLDITYGPATEHRGRNPRSTNHPDPVRAYYQGVTWKNKRIEHGPGEYHRALFGAPAAESDDGESSRPTSGAVIFHDALFVPGSVQQPLAPDILTVHQREYYRPDSQSRPQSRPNDYDNPNPVAFLTVRPRARFLVALGGDLDWAKFAMKHLLAALDEWGIGAKTSAGYGRLATPAARSDQQTVPPPGPSTASIAVGTKARWRVTGEKTKHGGFVFKQVEGETKAILHPQSKPPESLAPGQEVDGWVKTPGNPVQITLEEPKAPAFQKPQNRRDGPPRRR